MVFYLGFFLDSYVVYPLGTSLGKGIHIQNIQKIVKIKYIQIQNTSLNSLLSYISIILFAIAYDYKVILKISNV